MLRILRRTVLLFVLGLALIWALHLIPNASTADVAFFGGFLLFSLAGAWHQDARKLHGGDAKLREFIAATSFLPNDLPIPPIYSKANPADAPIMTLALTSDVLQLSALQDLADTRLAPRESRARVRAAIERRYELPG